jgi:hypothetical protein
VCDCARHARPMGSEADWTQLDPDFAADKKALVAEDWNGAIAALKLAALRDARNADIQNYIGYAYRRLRQLGPAAFSIRLERGGLYYPAEIVQSAFAVRRLNMNLILKKNHIANAAVSAAPNAHKR